MNHIDFSAIARMAFVRPLMAFMTVLCLAATVASPAEARREWPVTGGSGDIALAAQCPPGEMLVGFSGRVGLWIDQIRLICAKPSAGEMGPQNPGSDHYGGMGGGAKSAVCDRSSRLQSVSIRFTANYSQVASIGMMCASMIGNEFTNVGFGGSYSGYPKKCGGIMTGCDPEFFASQAIQQSCPNEQFVGANLRFGKHVNAIGFICDRVAIPTASAPPATSYSPAAPKPVRPTGRPKVAPVPTAMITAFAGVWKTVNSAQGNFEITLQLLTQYNPTIPVPLPVYGTFIRTDGAKQYDGILQGRIEPGTRTLIYNYGQPGSGNTGAGQFTLSTDGNAITGNGNDTKSGGFTWTGTRK